MIFATGERRAQVADPRWAPLAWIAGTQLTPARVVEVQPSTSGSGEQQDRVQPRQELFESGDRAA
jgi:hypothetical protein